MWSLVSAGIIAGNQKFDMIIGPTAIVQEIKKVKLLNKLLDISNYSKIRGLQEYGNVYLIIFCKTVIC